jgi:hypothetical protein
MDDNEPDICQKILEHLATASESQLSERLRKKCADFKGSRQELQQLFEEIYNSCCESSSFVKQVVNPEYTSKY